jgi:predicted ATP-grasp superfamily ATP-dependent carboligase
MRQQVRVASTHAEAREIIDDMRFRGGEPVIQEFIDGQLMGVTAITDKDSQMIAQLHQFAPLTWRPTVGEPARAFTMPIDPILAGKVAALLSDLGWFGLVQLQFLVPEDGRPQLIDFNGRTYSSLALSIAAGINFQDLWGRLATDRKIEAVGRAAEGVRYQWMEGDLKRALTERRGGPARDVLSCFGYSPGAVHPIWTWRDPRPALHLPEMLFAKRKIRPGSVAPARV